VTTSLRFQGRGLRPRRLWCGTSPVAEARGRRKRKRRHRDQPGPPDERTGRGEAAERDAGRTPRATLRVRGERATGERVCLALDSRGVHPLCGSQCHPGDCRPRARRGSPLFSVWPTADASARRAVIIPGICPQVVPAITTPQRAHAMHADEPRKNTPARTAPARVDDHRGDVTSEEAGRSLGRWIPKTWRLCGSVRSALPEPPRGMMGVSRNPSSAPTASLRDRLRRHLTEPVRHVAASSTYLMIFAGSRRTRPAPLGGHRSL
jgi:hypothetical protein